jgi:hypothetical protein
VFTISFISYHYYNDVISQNNELIREIFQLGPVPMIIDKLHSESKAEKIERVRTDFFSNIKHVNDRS